MIFLHLIHYFVTHLIFKDNTEHENLHEKIALYFYVIFENYLLLVELRIKSLSK